MQLFFRPFKSWDSINFTFGTFPGTVFHSFRSRTITYNLSTKLSSLILQSENIRPKPPQTGPPFPPHTPPSTTPKNLRYFCNLNKWRLHKTFAILRNLSRKGIFLPQPRAHLLTYLCPRWRRPLIPHAQLSRTIMRIRVGKIQFSGVIRELKKYSGMTGRDRRATRKYFITEDVNRMRE